MKAIISAVLMVWAGTIAAQELPRKAWLGAELVPVPNGIAMRVVRIAGGTSEALGIKAGDDLLKINGQNTATTEAVRAAISSINAGESLVAEIQRKGKKLILKGIAVGRMAETSDHSEIRYEAVPWRDGLLRAVVNVPPGAGPKPGLLFIPGYTCSSIEGLPSYHPYKKVVEAFAKAGFVVVRIEKSGLGDNRDTKPCEDCDLQDEIDNFRVGFEFLASRPEVDRTKLFIFGHSMGGVVAPALSASLSAKGVMVYGTTAKSWFEYLLEMNRLQGMLAKPDPIEYEQYCREQAHLAYRYYVQGESLTDMAQHPSTDSLLRTHWQYDGDGRIFGRNADYWRQIQDMPVLENWVSTDAQVMVMYGGADFQAFSIADHEQIAYTVNHHHPGHAVLKVFPETDHYFAKSGSMQQAYDLFATGQYMQLFETFDEEVTRTATAWAAELAGIGPPSGTWTTLPTEPYGGKQDDIYFTDTKNGWYVNGYGRIYRTRNGGDSWTKLVENQGTFYRTIAFADTSLGFAGTIGTEYFPNVTDTVPLYRTRDGGLTWEAVSYDGPVVKGLCAIDIVEEPYINHGVPAIRRHIFAGGRVGGPGMLLVSHDEGATFKSIPVPQAGMITDIHMWDAKRGLICAATSPDISQSKALILITDDGGASWKEVFCGSRPFEITWKAHFPTPSAGYITVQSYNPDQSASEQHILKTTDGGATWVELPLCNDHTARPFGVGFFNDEHGFVGTMNAGYETKDGGRSWEKIALGRATNKIRIITPNAAYAIGVEVLRYGITQN